MYRVRQSMSALMALAILSISFGTQAQTTRRRPVYRGGEAQTRQLLRRLETNAERFRVSLAEALDQSRLDNTRREDNIRNVADDFNQLVLQVRERSDSGQLTSADVEPLIARASRLDRFVRNNRLTTRSQNDWTALRTDLNELASKYNVAWRTDNSPNTGYPTGDNNGGGSGSGGNYDRALTGTYRLNVAQSDDPRRQAQLATNTLPYRDRQRTYDQLLTRVEPPAELAIERRGSSVTIASTRAPQINFVADGNDRDERTTGGNTIRASASFSGNQLIVSSAGDRSSDFTVTFDPLDNGRRLQVTRRISMLNMREQIVVRSVYDRTADVARFDIYRGGQDSSPSGGIGSNGSGNSNGDFVIGNGTTVIATLNNDLSTRSSTDGERFTMTVREPSQYSGATIEGHISQVKRSGRVSGRSELTFNFDNIRLRDGRSYSFAGAVESMRTSSGETVRVDNEGTVQEGDSQTQRTVERAAIGTAVGAIIGAIAGGGKGAAIGAVVGAGGGAGSVYAQGTDDLDLRSGSEVTIRASSPR